MVEAIRNVSVENIKQQNYNHYLQMTILPKQHPQSEPVLMDYMTNFCYDCFVTIGAKSNRGVHTDNWKAQAQKVVYAKENGQLEYEGGGGDSRGIVSSVSPINQSIN